MEITQTMKLHIRPNAEEKLLLQDLTSRYAAACNYISQYIFENGFEINSINLQKVLYTPIREQFSLKSQMSISVLKTVTARYRAVKEQLFQNPYKYQDENGNWQYITKTLEWLWRPISFKRPQADLVRGRDYSFVNDGTLLSLNTLGKRIKVSFDVPEAFKSYFSGEWTFGGGKLVRMNGEWYFHIAMSRQSEREYSNDTVRHVVGIDRGLRFLATAYDEKGKCTFIRGDDVLRKRESFDTVRAQLQSKGTKSAKRALKRISGRENRWMSDVNHRISKTLCDQYGSGTLFVLEDLTGVSFADENFRSTSQKHQLRSWAFYELEKDLEYKASAIGSKVLKVPANYTSQRCPKCGRIHKENRQHEIHEYMCDCCGYRSNDDRIGAMNIQMLGTLYVSGDENPRIRVSSANKTIPVSSDSGT